MPQGRPSELRVEVTGTLISSLSIPPTTRRVFNIFFSPQGEPSPQYQDVVAHEATIFRYYNLSVCKVEVKKRWH